MKITVISIVKTMQLHLLHNHISRYLFYINPIMMAEIFQDLQRKVTEEMNEKLIQPVTYYESNMHCS